MIYNPLYDMSHKKHTCQYNFIDGGWVHVNAKHPMSPEVQQAIENLVRLAKKSLSESPKQEDSKKEPDQNEVPPL